MIRGSISFIRCIYLALVIANVYSDQDSNKEYDSTLKLNSSISNITESTAEKDLGALLDATENAMVTLVAGDTRLAVHRAVLAARGPVIAAMLEANSSHVVLPDVEGPVLRRLVAFLYTLEVPQHDVITPELQAAADRYGLPVLKAECRQRAATPLSVETAAATAVLAVRHNCSGLRQAAVSFIKAHIPHVVASHGWADAVYNRHRDIVEVTRMLFVVPEETRNLSDAEKGQRLIRAAAMGSVEDLEVLLAAGADVGARDSGNGTALHWAAYRGHTGAVRRLLEAGAEVDARDRGGITALRAAAFGGHAEVVGRLLEAGADVEARDAVGFTALHSAAGEGHTETVRRLLEAGAEVGARGMWQRTPLHMAAEHGRVAVVRLLLQASADPNAVEDNGRTALHTAVEQDRAEVVAVLIQAGADKGARDASGISPQDIAQSQAVKRLLDVV